jgi:phage terminase large subunit GpA-like protein
VTECERIAYTTTRAGLPGEMALRPSQWAARHVQLPGSVLVATYTPEATPWTEAIIDSIEDFSTRSTTVMAPVQSGKSVIGEVSACYWLATSTGGDLQWNWENDQKALKRWDKRIEKILTSCAPLKARWPNDANKAKRGLIVFPHANLQVQGQETASNLDSDSIRFQINEELHSWHEGRLQKAVNRLTAVWNAKQLNLSNAGDWGDQLHEAYTKGTQERWGFTCPHCGKWQEWRTRRERNKDRSWKLGGLVYDSDGCKLGPHQYDYAALAKTIRYECEHCGHEFSEHERRSLKSSYRAQNPSPVTGHRSFSWDAVAVHYIPWLSLIQEKHLALKALYAGDNGPWRVYITERECRPWRADEEPHAQKINLSTGIKKANVATGEFDVTIGTVDVQRGGTMDARHFWVIIRGYKANKLGNTRASMLWEGRAETYAEVEKLMADSKVHPGLVFVDSGDQTESVYQWCVRSGYTALKGLSGDGFLTEAKEGEEDEVTRLRKIWRIDPDKPVEVPLDDGSVMRIPLVLYAKDGIRNRLAAIRESPNWQWEIPEDVSDDFVNHYAAEQMTYTAEGKRQFRQLKRRNDLFVCDCYQALGYDIYTTFKNG